MGRLAEDAEWINIYYTDREEGISRSMGKIAISLQIVPEEDALAMPVGLGRSEPNSNPYLPPPVGRLRMSANPFLMIKELIGPKLCLKLVCLFCCVFGVGFMCIFGAALMSTLTFLQMNLRSSSSSSFSLS